METDMEYYGWKLIQMALYNGNGHGILDVNVLFNTEKRVFALQCSSNIWTFQFLQINCEYFNFQSRMIELARNRLFLAMIMKSDFLVHRSSKLTNLTAFKTMKTLYSSSSHILSEPGQKGTKNLNYNMFQSYSVECLSAGESIFKLKGSPVPLLM